MGSKSRNKGANGERELAHLLQDQGYPVRRGVLLYGREPDCLGLPGVHIEVKRTERFQLYPALEQAQRDAVRFQDGTPAVFHRSNRHPWVVVMALEDWLEMYRQNRKEAKP